MEQIVTYEYPIILQAIAEQRPPAMANKSFPYNDLTDDRRFEELLYALFRDKINNGSFQGFDGISLMSGVRDKGRDCSLTRNGKNHGLIQCKKYGRNIGKGFFGEEITKFAMYSLLESKLIEDPDDFTYYIAVSQGFVLDCSDFIDDFNNLIAGESELSSWIDKNLRIPTLAGLKLDNIEPQVRDILSRIKVEKIVPQDLDGYLSEPSCQQLQPLFFELRVLIDNQAVEQLRVELKELRTGEMEKEQLDQELDRGSSSLKHENNQFEDIPNSHIQRSETDELLEWLKQPAPRDDNGKEQNICLLAGNAGTGKTVILKDLYDRLALKNLPVLALKADKLYATSIMELQQKIGLTLPVFQFIEQCKQKDKQTVLVIDQIDALSQAMSADRSFLEVYKSLIDRYTHDPNVRIIISVRLFDLYYDPSLRVYKNIKTIVVSPLTESQIFFLLEKIGINKEQVTSKLLQLLKVPNQLNIFARISPGSTGSLGITNIQGLYGELWRQKVMSKPRSLDMDPKRIRQLCYKLVKQMFQSQRISLSEKPYEDYDAEISYLASERILKREDGQLQFFHQSFYDFVFAKRFVEKGEDLIAYLKKQEQSLLIRSALKMILNYLRDYDQHKYEQIIGSLLEDGEVHYHIKHMLVSMLAFLEHPTVEEKEMAQRIMKVSLHLSSHFFEQARSQEWFEMVMGNQLISFLEFGKEVDDKEFLDLPDDPEMASWKLGYLKRTAVMLLGRFINAKNPGAWAFLEESGNAALIGELLYGFEDWSFDPAYQLLEKSGDFFTEDQFGYMHILEKIASHRPDYSWAKVQAPLVQSAQSDKNSHNEYEEVELLKALSKSIPEKMIGTLEAIIIEDLPEKSFLNRPLIGDYKYTYIDLKESEDIIGREYLYRLLAVCLRRAARKRAEEFYAFLSRHQKSKHKAMLRLLIFAMGTNVSRFSNEVFGLFSYLRDIGALVLGQDFRVEFRQLFSSTFPHFSPSQQAEVATILKSLVNKEEIYAYKEEGVSKIHSYWGKGKYTFLLRLPADFVNADSELKRQLQELKRRFGPYQDKSSTGSVLAGVVQRPLQAEAYEKMSVEQWLNSFRRYSSDRDPFGGDFLKGGIEEHSYAFREAAGKADPERMYSLVEQSMADERINFIYPVKGLWGLVDAGAELQRAVGITKKLIADTRLAGSERYILYFIKPMVSGEQTDIELIDFLIVQSENYQDLREDREDVSGETQIGGLVTRGINTIHGSAAKILLSVQDPRFEEQVFLALERLLSTAPDETRAALYFRFAYLNHLNRDRAYQLFRASLLKETSIYVTASALWSLQYMGNVDFPGLKDVYEKLVVSDTLGNDDTNGLVTILYFSYLFDKPGAEELLYKLLDHNSKSRIWALSEGCRHYHFNQQSAEKTHTLLMYLVDNFANDPADPMEIRFFHIEHIKLAEIHDFLDAYINSVSFTFSGNLLKYLTRQCSSNPQMSIALFNRAIQKKSSKNDKRGHVREKDDYTKFIVGAFTTLNGKDKASKILRKQLLESFDEILKDYRYRTDTDKVLEELL